MGPARREVSGESGRQGEGPYLRFWVRWDGQRITDARYETYPCPNAHRCGAWVVAWLRGRTPVEARRLSAGDLELILRLPLGKEHCAQLAIEAMHEALARLKVLSDRPHADATRRPESAT